MARYLLFHNVITAPFKYIVSIAAITAALTLSAKATFIVDDNPSHDPRFFLFNDVANHGVSDFDGFVGRNSPRDPEHTVHIHATGNVTSGSGFANIKPVHGTNLTDLIFTPEVNTAFSDFSFRGQLTPQGAGTVHAIVTDSLGGTFDFFFTGLGQNQDFARQGVISLDGETIQSVELISDFKEVKQIEFSPAGGVPPVPDGGATAMLLGAALSVLGMVRRYLKS